MTDKTTPEAIVFGEWGEGEEVETSMVCKTCGKPPRFYETYGLLHGTERFYICGCRSKYTWINRRYHTLKQWEEAKGELPPLQTEGGLNGLVSWLRQ